MSLTFFLPPFPFSPGSTYNVSSCTITPPILPASLSTLQSNKTLLILPRRTDYHTNHPDPLNLEEPDLIILIGTSHNPSPENPSASQVREVISHFRPDAVCVELCRSRTAMLHPPTKIQAMIGGLASALRLPLGGLLSPDTGGEFRAAREGAEEMGALVVLGDRPVGVTLRRAWQSLSAWERVLLGLGFVKGLVVREGVDSDLKGVIERGEAGGEVVDRYLGLLKDKFPKLYNALVEERDMYLAWSLKRSRAVRGRRCVVGVVGRAHVDGIERWVKVDDEERRKGGGLLWFRSLVG